jgi:phage FluMu protein Com
MKIQANFIHLYKYSVVFIMKNLKKYNSREVLCHRCEKLWYTRSLNPYYVCCPRCKTSVNVRKNKVQTTYTIAEQVNNSQSEQISKGDPS